MTTCRYINSGQSNFEYEYLGEFETELKNFLGHESGAQACSFDGKKQRSKISCYCPFKCSAATGHTESEADSSCKMQQLIKGAEAWCTAATIQRKLGEDNSFKSATAAESPRCTRSPANICNRYSKYIARQHGLLLYVGNMHNQYRSCLYLSCSFLGPTVWFRVTLTGPLGGRKCTFSIRTQSTLTPPPPSRVLEYIPYVQYCTMYCCKNFKCLSLKSALKVII
jgi:hypothetical protein